MVTHIQIDDRPACPRNCTTYQQYGDCEHQRPSEVVDLKRETATLRALVLRLAKALVREEVSYDEWQEAVTAARRIVRQEGRGMDELRTRTLGCSYCTVTIDATGRVLHEKDCGGQEITTLRALVLRLGEELERDWQIIHGYRCAPAPECDGDKKTCMWPRYAVLETDPAYRAVKEGKGSPA